MTISPHICSHGRRPSSGPRAARCPVLHCTCCGSRFGVVGSVFGLGNGEAEIKTWQPRNRCGPCGGGYIKYSTWSPLCVNCGARKGTSEG